MLTSAERDMKVQRYCAVFWHCWVFAGVMLVALSPAHAASKPGVSSLGDFIDGIVEQAIVQGETVGATVSVVQNNRLLIARGYGLADRTHQVPVQARTTTFRIGSITKVLVWMSVLQQVEAQRLQLDRDVNEYLSRFKLAEDYNDPITLRHLMTHTAGFEDDVTNLFVGGPRQLRSISDVLLQQMPQRVRLPGTLAAYSNYGAALAGHIVAEASGKAWQDYVGDHLLAPLNMTKTSMRQPLSPAMDAARSKGFVHTGAGFKEQSFSFIPLSPAGAGSSTAVDIARLMVELLNAQDTAILSAKSKALLLGGAFVPQTDVNGMTLGMYEMSIGDARAVGHDGSTLIFSSRMILWPEQNLGLFVAVNSDTGKQLIDSLTRTVAHRLGLDQRADVYQPVEGGQRFAGNYIGARRNYSGIGKLLGVIGSVEVVYDPGPDLLRVRDINGVRRYRQIKTNVFAQLDGSSRMVFGRFEGAGNEVSGHGKATTVYFSERPMVGFERADPVQTPQFNLLLLLGWLLVAGSVVLYWPVSTIAHVRRGVSLGSVFLTAIVLGSVVVVLIFAYALSVTSSHLVEFYVSGMREIESLLWYPVAFAVLVLVQIGFLYRVWMKPLWWPSRRLHFCLVLMANGMLVWWFWHWNLLPESVLTVLR